MRHLQTAAFVLFAFSSAACTAAVDDEVGSASIAITSVPSDVSCITLTATGSRTVAKNYDVVAGQSSVLALGSLPVGAVSFRGDAYAGACSTITAASIPSFVADPVNAVVSPTSVTPVSLMMRRNGQSSVSVDWEDTAATTHTLTVAQVGGGNVVSMPSGINCGADCSEAYANGAVVTLSAMPHAGYTFAGWTGGGCAGTGACSVTMSTATTVTATFVAAHTLAVTRAGTGAGIVSSSPGGINCGVDCTESYTNGTTVTLVATPSAGSTFVGWSGGCTGTGSCTVTMTAARTITANFALSTFALSVNVSGNGTVTSSPAGINCGSLCTSVYPVGTAVTLTATSNPFSFFQGWSGACTGSSNTCTVVLNSSTNVTAFFNP